MEQQAAQSLAVVGGQMAGLPMFRLYDRMAEAILGPGYDLSRAVELYEQHKTRTGKIYHVSMKTATDYELSWDGFEELVVRYASMAGVPESSIIDLFNEIRSKMCEDAPDLRFVESWVPFYALRFGEVPGDHPTSRVLS